MQQEADESPMESRGRCQLLTLLRLIDVKNGWLGGVGAYNKDGISWWKLATDDNREDFWAKPKKGVVKFCGLRIPSLLFADDVVLFASSNSDSSLHWDSLQLSVKQWGWESATLDPRPWFLAGEGWIAPPVGGELFLPQMEEFRYLGALFTSEGKMEHEIDSQIGAMQCQ